MDTLDKIPSIHSLIAVCPFHCPSIVRYTVHTVQYHNMRKGGDVWCNASWIFWVLILSNHNHLFEKKRNNLGTLNPSQERNSTSKLISHLFPPPLPCLPFPCLPFTPLVTRLLFQFSRKPPTWLSLQPKIRPACFASYLSLGVGIARDCTLRRRPNLRKRWKGLRWWLIDTAREKNKLQSKLYKLWAGFEIGQDRTGQDGNHRIGRIREDTIRMEMMGKNRNLIQDIKQKENLLSRAPQKKAKVSCKEA